MSPAPAGRYSITIATHSAASNTFSGQTRILSGTLGVTAQALEYSTVNLATGDTGLLEVGSTNTTSIQIAYFGGLAGSRNFNMVSLSGTNLSVNVGYNNTNTIYTGILSDSGTATGSYSGGLLYKTGNGTLALGGASTYSRGTTLNSGTLEALNSSVVTSGTISSGPFGTGLLTLANATTLATGSTSAETYDNAVKLTGTVTLGLATAGAGNAQQTFDNASGAATTLSAATTLVVNSGAVWNQGIGETNSGTQLIKTGTGLLTLGGANTFTGGLRVNQGIVNVGAATNIGPAPASFSGTSVILDSGTLAFTSSIASVPLSSKRGISISSNGGAIATLNNSEVVMTAAIADLTTGGALTKNGSGALTLNGVNTYSGGTLVNSGTLNVNGNIVGTTSIQAGAVLSGSGSVGSIDSLGTISPGYYSTRASGGSASPGLGILTATGTVTVESTGTLALTLNGATAGSYGQLVSGSGITLASGAALSLTLGYTPTNGDVLTIVSNAGGAVSGLFTLNGTVLSEGSTFDLTDPNTSNQDLFTISYQGGADGFGGNQNDIDLIAGAVPEPGAWASVTLGGLFLLLARRKRHSTPHARTS